MYLSNRIIFFEEVSQKKRVERNPEADAPDEPAPRANSRKSIASAFIYCILQSETDAEHRLSQKEILDLLAERYGVVLERKALGRYVRLLADSDVNVFWDPKLGAWYEERPYWA